MKSATQMFLATIALLFFEFSFSQNAESTDEKKLTKEQALEDYKILYDALINYHPVPFFYNSKNDLSKFYDVQKNNMPDNLSELEFVYIARQLTAQLGCGHTFAKPSNDWYFLNKGKSIFLPFEVKNIAGKLYISNTIEDDFEFKINDEILSINNLNVNDILAKMSLMQERDGLTESFRHTIIENRFRTYILFITGIPKEYLVEYKNNQGEIKKVVVQPTDKKMKEIQKAELPASFEKIISNKWSSLSYDASTNVAYLKVSSFGDRKEYKKHYISVFKFLNGKPNTKLILDLRNNGGGHYDNGNTLLTYLIPNRFDFTFQKPKEQTLKNDYIELDKWSKLTKFAFSLKPSKHKIEGQSTTTFSYKPNKYLFNGKVHVITNGITFSTAALVASHLKESGAIFFGQETGGAELGCNGMLLYKLILPNSKIDTQIAMYHVKSNSTKGEFGYGVKPNHPILPNIDRSKDHVLDQVFKKLK